MNKKKIVILTDGFPWGKSEKSFLFPEIQYLYSNYEICIIARANDEIAEQEQYITKLEPSIQLHRYNKLCLLKKEKIEYLFKGLFSPILIKEILRIIKEKKKGKETFKQTFFFYADAMKYKKWIEKLPIWNDLNNTVFYSYWSNNALFAVTCLKRKYKNIKVITRMHGYDLYNERFPGGRQPFKFFIDSKINKILFISEETRKYYCTNLVPQEANHEKHHIVRLGSKRAKENIVKQIHNEWLIVSCSNVISLKRIELIIEGLSLIKDKQIHWIHFGDGICMDSIHELAKKMFANNENISYDFKGYQDNNSILAFYEENQVDCFITTSSTEGCPVSIQEAEAYGIPIIGTNVGAISSMIQDNGVLLSQNPSSVEVNRAIEKIMNSTNEEKEIMKINSYKVWEENYNLDSNLQYLSQIIANLFCDD